MSDHLIAEPTNESNPGIIEYLTLQKARNLIFEAERMSRYSDPFTSLPRNFKDARTIKECDSEITKESSARRETRLVLESLSYVVLAVGAADALFGVTQVIAKPNDTLDINHFLIVPVACAVISFAFRLPSLIREIRDTRSKVNMIRARDFDMRDVCADGAYKLISVHEGVIHLSKRMLDCDHSQLRGINFANLSDAYDSYTDMLVFVLANKDQLSDELRKDYARSLLKRALKLKQELKDIDDVISEKTHYMNEALRESQQTEQDFIDDRARAIMPIDKD